MKGPLVGVVLLAGALAPAEAQQPDVLLLRCAERSSSLCVSSRVDLEPANARRIMAVDPATLSQAWRGRFLGDTALQGIGQAMPAAAGGRILILLDVSGSMKGTKIGTARLVLRQFLRSLDSLPRGSVRVAVAPFGSVDVARRIQGSRFTIPDSAVIGIDGLPPPERENTALFSAVSLGTERLRTEIGAAPAGTVGLLVVITDGNNDIRAGDDAGLLQGAAGLTQAARAVAESQIGVGIIGIGDLDQQALRNLAGPRGQAFGVADGDGAFELGQRLGQIRRMLGSSWDVTIRLATSNRGELGRGPGSLGLDLVTGQDRIPGGTGAWRPPLVALPAFAGSVPAGVLSAALVRTDNPGSWVGAALLAAFVVLLLIEIWIVLPRFLWPPVRPAVAAAEPTTDKGRAPKPVAGALRSDLKEVAPRKPTDVTAARARRA